MIVVFVEGRGDADVGASGSGAEVEADGGGGGGVGGDFLLSISGVVAARWLGFRLGVRLFQRYRVVVVGFGGRDAVRFGCSFDGW